VNLLGTNLARPAAVRNDKVQFAEIYPVPLSTREPLPGNFSVLQIRGSVCL
jgi:hypothetical protein